MRGIQLGFLVATLLSAAACGETSSEEGTGGTGGTGDQHPVDQCVNDADQAIYDDLGAGAVGDVAAGCANPAAGCGGPLGAILGGDTSESARKALGGAATQWREILSGKRPIRIVNPTVWPKYAARFEAIMGHPVEDHA